MGKKINVLIELRTTEGLAQMAPSFNKGFRKNGLETIAIDENYKPVPMESSPGFGIGENSYIIKATMDEDELEKLMKDPNIIEIWMDSKIAPFNAINVDLSEGIKGAHPFSAYDCDWKIAKGNLKSVAQKLGADKIWQKGFKGDEIVIGIVDGGVSAIGRVPNGKIDNVIGGFPKNSWGTVARWGSHGNMTATDAMGMAPNAKIYDIRISDGYDIEGCISTALQGFQWAIEHYEKNGTPQILSNSWGIYQKNWDQIYATNPNHPFTRQVIKAINLGIIVLFAAGNCGATCPSGECRNDIGPGKSIWGANGHPKVITVGAVNQDEEFIGYSSSGPASLSDKKPDFCGISHFKGYFNSDTGTSAACPIVAGVIALLKQANSNATPDAVKKALWDTAKQIDNKTKWNRYSGYGIIQADKAYSKLKEHLMEQKSK